MQGPALYLNSIEKVPHLNNIGCGTFISLVVTVLELALIYYGC